MRVLVCGGREYKNRDAVFRCLDAINNPPVQNSLDRRDVITLLIHGCATGADTLAGEWAEERGIPVDPYPIEEYEGGFGRNARMFFRSRPDLVVHFPGGNGTRHMVRLAQEYRCDTQGGLDTQPEPAPWLL